MVVQVGWEPGHRGLPHACLCIDGRLPSTALPEAVAPGTPEALPPPPIQEMVRLGG